MDKLRIGIITYALDRSFTGIGRYTVEIVRAMAARPDDVELVLISSGGLGPLADLGLAHEQLKAAALVPTLMTVGAAQIPGIVRKHKLDVVHDPNGITPLAFGTGRAASVTTVHDVIPFSFPGVSTTLDTLIYKRWLPFALRRMTGILTVSHASKADIIKYMHSPAEKIHVIHGGVDESYQPAEAADIERVREKYNLPTPYLLYVGSVEERKNLKRILEAYVTLKQNGLPQQMVIVGPQKWKYHEIMEAVNANNVADTVHFTGYVEDEDLPIIYSGADVFVYPSLYEGFGLPPLEAMAAGVPVITSNVSSLPEVVGDAGMAIDPYDVGALADAMQQLLTDEGLRATFREKGLERAKSFSWQRSGDAHLDVYRDLAGKRTP